MGHRAQHTNSSTSSIAATNSPPTCAGCTTGASATAGEDAGSEPQQFTGSWSSWTPRSPNSTTRSARCRCPVVVAMRAWPCKPERPGAASPRCASHRRPSMRSPPGPADCNQGHLIFRSVFDRPVWHRPGTRPAGRVGAGPDSGRQLWLAGSSPHLAFTRVRARSSMRAELLPMRIGMVAVGSIYPASTVPCIAPGPWFTIPPRKLYYPRSSRSTWKPIPSTTLQC